MVLTLFARTATQSGILHHRYVPTVGKPGQHDASYTTFLPAPPGKAPVIAYQSIDSDDFAKVKLDIPECTFEQLPTLWNIINGLREVPRTRVVEVASQTFQGASDLIKNQRVD